MNQPDELGRRRGRPGRPGWAVVTHERLVKIAQEVFSERGYEGTTFEEVAQRLGVTRPALHYHVPDKRTLYHDVLTSTYTDVVAPAINRAAQESDLARQLSVFVEAIGQDTSVPAFLCSSVADCRSRPELRDSDHCPLTVTRRFLTWAVNDAVDRGELPAARARVEPLVEALTAMLLGMGFYAGFVGTPSQIRAMTKETHQLLTGTLLEVANGSQE